MIHQPSALITGANRGIGFETARQLGKKGFYIFLTARKQDEGEKARRKLEAENITGEFIQLDITSLESIGSAFEKVSRKISHLDVLINNAAILSKQDNDLLTVDAKIVSDTMNTNVTGVLLVTQHFAPLLSKGSRVLNLSSGGGSMTDPIGGWSPVYCISKSAVNALTRHLAYYLGEKKVAVNAACPGWVRTDMGGRSATRSVEKGAETIVWLASEAPHTLTGKFFRDKKEIPW
jgi:NAD(P)-dependent dehydrogenase (short-subunit alcohol dehydrogenase family)